MISGKTGMKMKLILLVVSFMLVMSAGAGEPEHNGPAVVYSTDGDFLWVKQDLIAAIENRGMVISYISHAQSMLQRTASAVGDTQPVYDDAEIVLFCKSDLSHHLVAANPHNIVLCPYAIAVYTLAGKPDRVYLSFREPYEGDASYQPITKLLSNIINEVIGD